MANVSTVRPRIWLTPAILATLKARAAKPTSRMSNLLALVNRPGPDWDIGIINYLLAFQVTGDPKHATNAYSLMQQSMAGKLLQITGDSGYEARNYFPAAALTYDWLHGWMSPAQRAALQSDLEACSDWVWPETDPIRALGWGIADPGSNYYEAFMDTWMAGLALSGDSPKAAGYINSCRTRWRDAVLPYLHNDAAGGYWQEGVNYGTSSLCSMLYNLWAHSTATDEILMVEPWLEEALRCRLHITTPDLARSYAWGDAPQNSGDPLSDYDRRAMLILAAAGVQSGVCRKWLDATTPNISQQRANAWAEALFYPEETPAVDYAAIEPKTYFMPGAGVFSTRTGWGTSDTQFLAQAGPTMESHGDDASGAFMLFRSDWIAAEAKLFSHSGLSQDAIDSNTVTFGAANQTNTQNTVSFIQREDTEAYSYLQANLAPAYMGQVSTYLRSFFFLKSAGSQFLLVKDDFSGNASGATFHLQTLVKPVAFPGGKFTAGYPGATLFGLAMGGSEWKAQPVTKSADQAQLSYRLDLPDGGANQILVALEAAPPPPPPPGSTATTLGAAITTPGLQGVALGKDFAAFMSGPGPWTYTVPSAGMQYLLGLKPSTIYIVNGSFTTSTPAGVMSWMGAAGSVTISEKGVPPPPPPPPPAGRSFSVIVSVPASGPPTATITELPLEEKL